MMTPRIVTGELAFRKGNRYVLADGDTATFVYQTGRGRIRFKTGDVAAFAGTYDRVTDVVGTPTDPTEPPADGAALD